MMIINLPGAKKRLKRAKKGAGRKAKKGRSMRFYLRRIRLITMKTRCGIALERWMKQKGSSMLLCRMIIPVRLPGRILLKNRLMKLHLMMLPDMKRHLMKLNLMKLNLMKRQSAYRER